MSKKRKQNPKAKAEPQANSYAHMSPARRKLHENADRLSREFARIEKTVNRTLLVILILLAVLWLAKILPGQTARYLIVALLGMSLAINGISGYRNSKWAGFFLMVFGTLLFLGNLYMLGQ